MKTCRVCKKLLDVETFYKDTSKKDGRRKECKVCTKSRMDLYNLQNRAQVNAAQRKRNSFNTEEIKKRRNLQIKADPIRFKAYMTKYRKANVLKERARRYFMKQLLKGKITKGPCEVSNERCYGRIEGHHADYAKRLDVMWLCKAHHSAWHRIFLSV